MNTITAIIIAVLGSNTITVIVQWYLNRKAKNSEDYEAMRKALAAVTYGALSGEVERLLNKGFATPEERRVLQVLFDAYKANGWNGDMDARMEKVHMLRTDKPRRGKNDKEMD